MLRSGVGPGYIIYRGGDIDNRLKTLLDSLRMPTMKEELPSNDPPEDNENPFYCLLENDNLITDISISTDRLLEPQASDSHVKLFIRVQIKKMPTIGANMIIRK